MVTFIWAMKYYHGFGRLLIVSSYGLTYCCELESFLSAPILDSVGSYPGRTAMDVTSLDGTVQLLNPRQTRISNGSSLAQSNPRILDRRESETSTEECLTPSLPLDFP